MIQTLAMTSVGKIYSRECHSVKKVVWNKNSLRTLNKDVNLMLLCKQNIIDICMLQISWSRTKGSYRGLRTGASSPQPETALFGLPGGPS